MTRKLHTQHRLNFRVFEFVFVCPSVRPALKRARESIDAAGTIISRYFFLIPYYELVPQLPRWLDDQCSGPRIPAALYELVLVVEYGQPMSDPLSNFLRASS